MRYQKYLEKNIAINYQDRSKIEFEKMVYLIYEIIFHTFAGHIEEFPASCSTIFIIMDVFSYWELKWGYFFRHVSWTSGYAHSSVHFMHPRLAYRASWLRIRYDLHYFHRLTRSWRCPFISSVLWTSHSLIFSHLPIVLLFITILLFA